MKRRIVGEHFYVSWWFCLCRDVTTGRKWQARYTSRRMKGLTSATYKAISGVFVSYIQAPAEGSPALKGQGP